MSNTLLRVTETFRLSEDLSMVGEGPSLRRQRTRANPAYRDAMVAAKRAEPGQDLTSELLQAGENGDALSDLEVRGTLQVTVQATAPLAEALPLIADLYARKVTGKVVLTR